MILASASPRRRDLLRELGISVDVQPSDVDESPLSGELPVTLVERLARLKAQACLDSLGCPPDHDVIVAADTIVWTGEGGALGKPADARDAERMLHALSGRSHCVSSGVCLLSPTQARSFVETTRVCFYDLSDEEIASYVASGEPRDKAGSYGIQGRGRLFVRGIEGDFYNVVGLPVARLMRELNLMGEALGPRLAPGALPGGKHGW